MIDENIYYRWNPNEKERFDGYNRCFTHERSLSFWETKIYSLEEDIKTKEHVKLKNIVFSLTKEPGVHIIGIGRIFPTECFIPCRSVIIDEIEEMLDES